MTDISLPADRFSQGEFRIGRVFSRAWSLLARNFLKFMLVTVIAALPTLLIPRSSAANAANPFANIGAGTIGAMIGAFLLLGILGALAHATILYAAAQSMRGQPVNLMASIQVALRRFFPLLGLGICLLLLFAVVLIGLSLGVFALSAISGDSVRTAISVLAVLGGIVLIFLFYLTFFVATPACVIERLGPIRSMTRSRALTKGYRWKLLGLMLSIVLVLLLASVVVGVIAFLVIFFGGTLPTGLATSLSLGLNILMSGVWGAYFGIVVFVAYHDLRVAKEGIGTDQIAAVFE
jgi:hypothetical protein